MPIKKNYKDNGNDIFYNDNLKKYTSNDSGNYNPNETDNYTDNNNNINTTKIGNWIFVLNIDVRFYLLSTCVLVFS